MYKSKRPATKKELQKMKSLLTRVKKDKKESLVIQKHLRALKTPRVQRHVRALEKYGARIVMPSYQGYNLTGLNHTQVSLERHLKEGTKYIGGHGD